MKIICYGDSNTYGYDGDSIFGARFADGERWPELLGRMLGCETVNCGLNGRRVPRYQRTRDADLALLRRCGERTLIIVMLGTNDILAEAAPEDTAEHMRAFLAALTAALPESAVLLVSPPSADVDGGAFAPAFAALAGEYETLARDMGLLSADAHAWQIPAGGDGIHFSARGHQLFALKLGQTLRGMLQ